MRDNIADEAVWNDLFHNCALNAYVSVWRETGQFPPDSETVRRLAYKLYEDEKQRELAQRHL